MTVYFGLSTKVEVIAQKAQHTKQNLRSNLSSKLSTVADKQSTKISFHPNYQQELKNNRSSTYTATPING
jgi:hypothetical protein